MFRKRIQLGLLHVAIAVTLVPINSTLNRVMIKELALSATLVATLASLPYLLAPIQVAIGSFSDRHPVFGFRRTPYILAGLLFCVTGVIVSPYAAFLMSDNFLAGIIVGLVAFGAWGLGFNLATVSYLSLATELSGERGRSKTIAVMWFMMITSIIMTAIVISQLVDPYTPEALIRAFQIIGLAALGLGLLGLVRLEERNSLVPSSANLSWKTMFTAISKNRQAMVFFWYLTILLAAILGQDILLEPFGGEAFGLSVQQTTRITSLWGGCVLAALLLASFLERRIGKHAVVKAGAWVALAGFVSIAASGVLVHQGVFYAGVILLGTGTGLSTVSNLSLMLDMTTAEQVGLFIGAWGMSNSLSRLIGTVMSGAVRDVFTQIAQNALTGYVVVFVLEALMILVSLILLRRIDVHAFQEQANEPSIVERAAIANDIN